MRAIGYRKPSPALDALEAFEIPRPTPESRDLLVEVRAVAVNPVDYKVASGTVPEAGGIKVVGYDAAGVVVEAGRETPRFCSGSVGYGPELSAKGERLIWIRGRYRRPPAGHAPGWRGLQRRDPAAGRDRTGLSPA